MKFSIIAALVVVLALTQGSLATESTVQEQLDAIKTKLVQAATDLAEKIKAQDMTAHAQTHLEPLTAEIKNMGTNLQAQLQPMADTVQTHLQPLVTSLQTEVTNIIRNLMDQALALGN